MNPISEYDRKRIEKNKEILSTLKVDLSFLSDYYFGLVKKNILKELENMLAWFAKDLENFYTNNHSNTKQTMLDWFSALETFRSVIVLNFKQGECSFDISKLSPTANHDIRNLFFKKINEVYSFIEEDLEYTDDEDKPALKEMQEKINYISWQINRQFHWSVAHYGNQV